MNKIVYVALNRAEGPSAKCGAVVFYRGPEVPVISDPHFRGATMVQVEDVGAKVQHQISYWGCSAPKNGGYDKTDFIVQWENNQAYAGRFDMEYGGTEAGENFWESLKNRIRFYAGLRRPAHFCDTAWAAFVDRNKKNGSEKEALEMLAKCEMLGGVS
jgi:hypothetical protein